MSRLTADLEGVRNFIGFGFAQILNMVLMIIFGAAMMFSIHWQLTLITLITMPFLTLTAFRFEKLIHPAFREMRQAMSQSYNRCAREYYRCSNGQILCQGVLRDR